LVSLVALLLFVLCAVRVLEANEALPSTTMMAKGATSVILRRVPDDGIQPQTAMDARGVVHLVYFKGDARNGDIFYTRKAPDADTFLVPLRVNSQPGSAIAIGTIRAAHLAIGKNNRVHVAWNGSGKAEPKPAGSAPMLYARLNDAGTAFEPQRNLLKRTKTLDGGGTLAADALGHVYVVWHAAMKESDDELQRAVFLAQSDDDGKTSRPSAKLILAQQAPVAAVRPARLWIKGTRCTFFIAPRREA
jgi:hypothetical protein